jgi:hypothetical protein
LLHFITFIFLLMPGLKTADIPVAEIPVAVTVGAESSGGPRERRNGR